MALILNKNILAGEVVQDSITDGVTNKAPSQNAVFDALALKINSSLLGANNGVAQLDANGKLPSSQLTVEAFEYKGNYNASTDSPALENGTGNAGDLYHVSVAGSQDFGAGSIAFTVGDKVVYNGSIWEKWDLTESVTSVNGASGVVVLDTGDIAEDTNLYFTEARVLGTDLAGFVSGAGTVADSDTILDAIEKLDGNSLEIDQNVNDLITLSGVAENATHLGTFTGAIIPDSSDIKEALQALETELESVASSPISFGKESISLSAGDITNQYVDLAETIKASSLDFMFSGLVQREGTNYTVSLTGGAGGVTRVTFAGQLATSGASELVASDVIYFKYAY
jgi:hypothetical protein